MTDVIQSMIRFSWAMSLFGVRQATEMVSALGAMRSPRAASRSFDRLAEAAENELDEAFESAYRTGDRWQRAGVDAVFGLIDPALDMSRNLTSQTVLRGSLTVLRQSAGMLEAAMPVERRWALQELRNKLEAFESFQYVEQILDFRSLAAEDLKQHLEQASESNPYLGLWLTEGLGFAFAEAAWEAGEPSRLLRQEKLDDLPSESLIPLHTGMGLALSRRVATYLPTGDLDQELERFAARCVDNAREGYGLAAYEALGLIVRQLAPEQVARVDAALSRSDDPRHRSAFWHGLGRGLYFVVSQAWPGSTGRAVAKIRSEAPTDLARWNAMAGLVWALTLVNIRQPGVVAEFLASQSFERDEQDAIGNGIASASLLWVEAVGVDAHLQTFRDYQSGAMTWEQMVAQPIAAALERWPEVKAASGPESIFIFQPGD
ncbi:MAG: hypothetical protein AAF560_27740 [Acidobacteriota bacterium]